MDTGVRYVQLRMKKKPRREVLEHALRLRRITAGSGTLIIVNDDVEIAAQADADGVHLGQADMSITEAREPLATAGQDFRPVHTQRGPGTPRPGPRAGLHRRRPGLPNPHQGPARSHAGAWSGWAASSGKSAHYGRHRRDRQANLTEVLRQGAVNYCVVRAVNLIPIRNQPSLRCKRSGASTIRPREAGAAISRGSFACDGASSKGPGPPAQRQSGLPTPSDYPFILLEESIAARGCISAPPPYSTTVAEKLTLV